MNYNNYDNIKSTSYTTNKEDLLFSVEYLRKNPHMCSQEQIKRLNNAFIQFKNLVDLFFVQYIEHHKHECEIVQQWVNGLEAFCTLYNPTYHGNNWNRLYEQFEILGNKINDMEDKICNTSNDIKNNSNSNMNTKTKTIINDNNNNTSTIKAGPSEWFLKKTALCTDINHFLDTDFPNMIITSSATFSTDNIEYSYTHLKWMHHIILYSIQYMIPLLNSQGISDEAKATLESIESEVQVYMNNCFTTLQSKTTIDYSELQHTIQQYSTSVLRLLTLLFGKIVIQYRIKTIPLLTS